MRRGRVLRAAVVVGLALSFAFVVAASGHSPAGRAEAAAAAGTFSLVSAPKCVGLDVAVGSACVDELSIAKSEWTVSDGNAEWNHPGQWTTTYAWKVPAGVPPSGRNMTVTVTASELTHNPNTRICPALGVSAETYGDFNVVAVTGKMPASVCAQSGQSDISQSAVVKLVPQRTTGTLELVVGVQDGPTYRYTYEAAPVGNVSVALSYRVSAPGELSSGHVAVGTSIQLVAKATPALPPGAEIDIFDKPQAPTSAPKSGFPIRACSTNVRCRVDRVETKRQKVHAYRAFVVLGHFSDAGHKVLASSNPVIISWVKAH